MSDQPETLAAILAEMRGAAKSTDLFNGEEVGEPLIRGTKVEDWADRIEAAAERERNAHTNDIHDALYKATGIPGNAAELREALEQALAYCESDQKSGIAYSDNDVLVPMLRAALAAPARNCDRFATEDEAREAYWAYREPLEFNNKPFVAITEWLLAPAKGGAE